MGGFLAISALVGVGVGLGAAALIYLVDWLEEFFLPFAIDQGHPWIFLTVPTGFLFAWFLARRFAPEVAGDGVPEAVAALEVHSGRMRGRVIPLKILATAATVGTGGSAGREGPIVQIGAAVGSVISRRFNLGEDQVRSLVAAGAGAGIGAAFNAPIAGMLFALEVILSSFAARHMSAIVIASITAAVTTPDDRRRGAGVADGRVPTSGIQRAHPLRRSRPCHRPHRSALPQRVGPSRQPFFAPAPGHWALSAHSSPVYSSPG